MPKGRIRLAHETILTVLMSISAIPPPFACAQTDTSSSSSSRPAGVEATPRDVQNYWTEERLKSAKPVELHPPLRPEGSAEVVPPSVAPSERGEGSPPQGR
jgi:hypothetical protein